MQWELYAIRPKKPKPSTPPLAADGAPSSCDRLCRLSLAAEAHASMVVAIAAQSSNRNGGEALCHL